MAQIVITAQARSDIEIAARTLELPPTYWVRIARSLRKLETFPLAGPQLQGRWAPNRLILGPWSWMILLYRYDEFADRVSVIAMHDARAGDSPRTA